MKQKIIIRNTVIFVSIFSFIMCKKDVKNREEEIIDLDFIVYHMDTLKSDKINKILFEYKNREFEVYSKRYLDVYYTVQDSFFSGELMDLEKYQFGVLEDAGKIDTLNIDVFQKKGDKYVTFFVYDEVQIPVSKDSINLKYVVTKFVSKTFIK